jgi:squalene-hopene/tetraprenyl-beta-curcumene cyclase
MTRWRELFRPPWTLAGLLLAFCVAAGLADCSQVSSGSPATWDPRTAAAYLDEREVWWVEWHGSARDHGTFCISCHTVLPYALARARLDPMLHASLPSASETRLANDVLKRVRLWSQTQPYYTDKRNGPHKSAQSRGTEAVLDALIQATEDARTGRLTPDTRAALDDMWAQQETTGDAAGAWAWLDFGLQPWEMKDAQYFGAAMAALAVGTAPEDYRSTPAIREPLQRLRAYLDRNYSAQPLHQRLALLWADTALPGLLPSDRRQSIIDAALHAQNSDGGWSLYALAPSDRRGVWMLRRWSDGYATGFVTFVLQRAGVPLDNPELQRGLAWLEHHQQPGGLWAAYSVNERMDWSSPKGRFMSDAATGYAVLALTESSGARAESACTRLRRPPRRCAAGDPPASP